MVLPPKPSVVRTTCVPPGNVIVTVGWAVNTPGTLELIARYQAALSPSGATVGPLRLALPGAGLTLYPRLQFDGAAPCAYAVIRNVCGSPTPFVACPGVIAM